MKRICFVAQFPPPIHGLSKAVDTLYNSYLNKEFEFEKIDITNNKAFLKTISKIVFSRADLFYFTISQTRGGNLRDLIIMKLFQLKRKKCLVHLHGGYYRTLIENDMPKWQKKANYRAISKIAGAIVLGPSLKWIFEGLVPNERIFTVPNCVDDQYLLEDEAFSKKVDTLESRSVKHVLYLSNFIRTKGYPEVLEMAKLEKERVVAGGQKRLHFDFAGKFFDDAEKLFFEKYVSENDLEEYVSYHGIVGGKEKLELLMQSDFFTLLTTYPNEGQPISILEAMGNGMVIITTNHAGIPDIVKDTVNGVVVDKTVIDVEKCYQTILSYSDMQIKKTVLSNRVLAQNEYTEEKYLKNMESIFRRY